MLRNVFLECGELKKGRRGNVTKSGYEAEWLVARGMWQYGTSGNEGLYGVEQTRRVW